jgi:hypothetical protein
MTRVLVLVAICASCGGSQQDVAVKGTDDELVRLAGDWEGDYKGIESGRSGTVKFSLQLGRHVAEGEVFMNNATPLKIEFIAVKAGQVKGTIAPYTDPNCSCQVETSFLGNVTGDQITGSFETKVSGQVQTGSWSVTRKRAP